jgi:hypothetical protein
MECPKCGQIKEDTVVYCDCGYDFTPDKMKKIIDSQPLGPVIKWILAVAILILVQESLEWLIGPFKVNWPFDIILFYVAVSALLRSRRKK